MPGEDALPELLRLGLRKENVGNIEFIWGSFGHSEPEALRSIVPHVIHMHAKFFDLRDGDEPNVRFEEVVRVLVEENYSGWLSSEYEGATGAKTFSLVRQLQAMVSHHAETFSCSMMNNGAKKSEH